MFTATDRRDNKCSHHEYYSQFVNNSILLLVENQIGLDRLKKSTDPHLNDIPLIEWDRISGLVSLVINRKLFKKCHNVTYPEKDRELFLWSLSSGVCIAKAAARILIESR